MPNPTKDYIHPKYKLFTKLTAKKDEEQRCPLSQKQRVLMKLSFKASKEVPSPQNTLQCHSHKCSNGYHQVKSTSSFSTFLPKEALTCQKMAPNGISHNPKNA